MEFFVVSRLHGNDAVVSDLRLLNCDRLTQNQEMQLFLNEKKWGRGGLRTSYF